MASKMKGSDSLISDSLNEEEWENTLAKIDFHDLHHDVITNMDIVDLGNENNLILDSGEVAAQEDSSMSPKESEYSQNGLACASNIEEHSPVMRRVLHHFRLFIIQQHQQPQQINEIQLREVIERHIDRYCKETIQREAFLTHFSDWLEYTNKTMQPGRRHSVNLAPGKPTTPTRTYQYDNAHKMKLRPTNLQYTTTKIILEEYRENVDVVMKEEGFIFTSFRVVAPATTSKEIQEKR